MMSIKVTLHEKPSVCRVRSIFHLLDSLLSSQVTEYFMCNRTLILYKIHPRSSTISLSIPVTLYVLTALMNKRNCGNSSMGMGIHSLSIPAAFNIPSSTNCSIFCLLTLCSSLASLGMLIPHG